MTDLNTAALRRYEREQDQAILDGLAIEQRQRELAAEMLVDGKCVHELLFDFDADVAGQLARAMRELDRACKGDRIAIDACLASLSNIQRELRNKAMDACAWRAQRDVEEGR